MCYTTQMNHTTYWKLKHLQFLSVTAYHVIVKNSSLHRQSADCWLSVGRLLVICQPTVGDLLANCWPTVGQQLVFFSIWCVPKRRSFVLSGFIKRLHVQHQAAISCRSAARGAAAFSEFWTYLEGQVQFKIIYVRFQGTHVRDAWYIIYVDVKQCRSKKISLGNTTYHHLELWHLGSITNRLSSLQQIALKPFKWDIRKAKDS